MNCPLCKCTKFYLKDPDDAYEIYEFECQDGQIRFDDPDHADQVAQVEENQPIFCQRCSWHGPYEQIE